MTDAKTPSPHRFLSANRKPKSTSKEVKAPSSLRRQFPEPAVDHDNDYQTHQFAQAPRFSHGRPKSSAHTAASDQSQKPTLAQALRASAQRAEDVEDATTPAEDDEMLLDGPDQPVQSVETPDPADVSGQHWSNSLAFSPKRRRLDQTDLQPSTTRAALEDLPPIGPQLAHSFVQPSQASTSIEIGSAQRPAFIRPQAQPQAPSEPLPEAFSPHRRGQKFVAGGMAATLQQWVLETGHAAVQSRRGQEYLCGEDYVMRVKVDEVRGDGPFVIRAKLVGGEIVDLLLAGGASAGSNQSRDIRHGCIVGIRAPIWEIELDSKTYTVGVDWRIIS